MLVLVDKDSSELIVTWERAKINLSDFFVLTHNDVLEDDRGRIRITCFVEPDVEFLKSETVFATDAKSLLDLEALKLAILYLDDGFERVDSTSFEPCVTPVGKVEVCSERRVSASLVCLG